MFDSGGGDSHGGYIDGHSHRGSNYYRHKTARRRRSGDGSSTQDDASSSRTSADLQGFNGSAHAHRPGPGQSGDSYGATIRSIELSSLPTPADKFGAREAFVAGGDTAMQGSHDGTGPATSNAHGQGADLHSDLGPAAYTAGPSLEAGQLAAPRPARLQRGSSRSNYSGATVGAGTASTAINQAQGGQAGPTVRAAPRRRRCGRCCGCGSGKCCCWSAVGTVCACVVAGTTVFAMLDRGAF